MSDIQIGIADPADDAGIRALLRRQPIRGRVTMSFERDPDFSTGCAVTGDDYEVVVARDGSHVVGVACRSTRRVYLNGAETRIGYLGQLRVDERYQGRWLVARGFSLLRELDRCDPLPAYLTAIIDDNEEALGILVRHRRPSFPNFHHIADYRTIAIECHPEPRRRRRIPRAESLQEIADFLQTHGPRRQLFPAVTAHDLENLRHYGLNDFIVVRNGNEIAGVAALWDQSAYKQTIIRGYSPWLKLVAPLFHLPSIGEPIRSAYASLICVANDDTTVFAQLLETLYDLAAERDFDYLLVGLDARDPLLRVALSYPHHLYKSRLYLATWAEGGELYERLDQRTLYVDIATL